MLYRIAKKSDSRREIKKEKNPRAKASRKSSDSSSDDLDSYSSLAINISRETYRPPAGRKETNRLDHVVTYNLKN